MCRYAMYGPYKAHYACFRCRKMFHQTAVAELVRKQGLREADAKALAHPCPQCGEPMKDLGLDFKPPRQADVKQWRKVELLFEHGVAFHSCGDGGPGERPATLKEVPAFLEGTRRKGEGERLLETYARRGMS